MRKLKLDELKRVDLATYKKLKKSHVSLLLDNIRSLNNIGSIFRTADAFRVSKIYLCGITGQPPHRDIQKTALGATESVDWEYHEDAATLLEQLKAEGVRIYALEQTDERSFLQDREFVIQPSVFILGNEVDGVSEELLELIDEAIEIPQHGTKHSFNVSVSAGILLWDLYSKGLKPN